MRKLKVMTIFGTRPEAIKLAPVIKALNSEKKFDSKVCVTAQHRQMLDQVLNFFAIRPEYDLDIMKPNQSLFEIARLALEKLEEPLTRERPDVVLVQGDTTTAFVGALAAYYLKISVGHVEAGLRTYNKFSPFPEEMNRVLSDRLSDYCFAPTETARDNLTREGISGGKIFVTGNTVIDALQIAWAKVEDQDWSGQLGLPREIFQTDRRVILVTGHRRESFGSEFESLCRGLKHIAEKNLKVALVYPVHLNPNVRAPVEKILRGVKGIFLLEPLDYTLLVWLMGRSYLVLTDSGGIQEEAPSLGKPVLVMRQKTERPEGIHAGVARLVGTDEKVIFEETQRLLDDAKEYAKMAQAVNPYGDGKASQRIVRILKKSLLNREENEKF
ncbi:UDP-N-acetylglucosamine 2-epimerase (non-hydrolyzing) [Candidatus Acetothermia bacterium]|nr:UDP-N-acetylglucosamine 2-epimerase (non-hydrolyzing) [Candidatus Acetothermia bacterium]